MRGKKSGMPPLGKRWPMRFEIGDYSNEARVVARVGLTGVVLKSILTQLLISRLSLLLESTSSSRGAKYVLD